MAPVTVFRLILIGIGIGAMFAAVLALARRKMTETLCLVWGFLALVFIAAGILLHPAGWKQYLSNEGLALIVMAGVCLLTAAYFISVGISDLLCRMRETAIQISRNPERTPPNGPESIRFASSEKLRTRRLGVRIPQGVPAKPADS